MSMLKLSECQQSKRYLYGFLFAPFAVLFWIGVHKLIAWAVDWPDAKKSPPSHLFFMLFPLTWFVQAFVGVPTIIILRYFKALNMWTLTTAGALVGLALSTFILLLQGYDLTDSFPLSRSVNALVNGASVAWLFGVLAFCPSTKDKQTRDLGSPD